MSETEFDPSAQTLPAYSDPCEVSRLRTLLDDLMKAVEPFARAGEIFKEPTEYDMCIYRPAAGDDYSLSGSDLRRAREAYLKAKGETNVG